MRATLILSRFKPLLHQPSAKLSPLYSDLLASGLLPDTSLLFDSHNVTISRLSKSGLPHAALALFLSMHRSSFTSIDHFTLPPVLRSCVALGAVGTGTALHGSAVKMGFATNLYVASVLVFLYASLVGMSHARNLFDESPKRDGVMWTSMVSGYAQSGQPELALGVLGDMVREGVELDAVVMVSLLLACGQLGWLRMGKSVHGFSTRRCFGLPVSLGNALIDMYVKSGSLSCAETVFGTMLRRDVISWSALILGYGLNGCADLALEHFEAMRVQGVEPNSVTFLGVLMACAHAGMVHKARALFDMMRGYGIKPDLKHFACMVDALARAGYLAEAERFIDEMPMLPDRAVLGALLAGSRMHGNVEVGERVFKRLMGLQPDKSGYYMGLANMYSGVGRYDDAERVRALMKDMNVDKLQGSSSIELDGCHPD